MFLTRGELPQEPVWALWFARAGGLLPLSALKLDGGCSVASLARLRGVCGSAAAPSSRPIQRQHLFNVYIHVGTNEANFTGVLCWVALPQQQMHLLPLMLSACLSLSLVSAAICQDIAPLRTPISVRCKH